MCFIEYTILSEALEYKFPFTTCFHYDVVPSTMYTTAEAYYYTQYHQHQSGLYSIQSKFRDVSKYIETSILEKCDVVSCCCMCMCVMSKSSDKNQALEMQKQDCNSYNEEDFIGRVVFLLWMSQV